MTQEQIVFGCLISVVIIAVIYHHIGWAKIKTCYSLWLDPAYWTSYNIIEAASWLAKGAVIVPGLIFGIDIWWIYWITLITSAMLIWVSERKVLPTLVGFNTLWIWLSLMVLAQHLI